jgi:hypothetical protein
VKPIKMLGLAALAALMAMALVGATSAMAENTQLCKNDETPCLAGNVVSHVHEETLTGAPATLLSSLGNVLCTALFLGDSLGLGAPLIIHGHFTYSSCVRDKPAGGTENCTVSETSTDSLINVLRLSHESADVTGTGKVNVHCGLFINCTYNGSGLTGTATGPLLSTFENGNVSISGQTTTKESGLCPETGLLDINTMPLEKVYIITP